MRTISSTAVTAAGRRAARAMRHGYRTASRPACPGVAGEPERQRAVGRGNVTGGVRTAVPPGSPPPAGLLSWGALGVVCLLGASTYLANRLIIATVPPLLIGGVRFLIGGTLLALIVLARAGRRGFRVTRGQPAPPAPSGLLLPAWGNGLVALAQQQVASGLAALLIASVPLYIVLLRAVTGDR